MRLFTRETAAQKWARTRPYGEAGSVDYWTEAMKRAFQIGESRAQGELDKLTALTGPQPPMEFTGFPYWFWDLWTGHLAPYLDSKDHPLAMPY